MNANLKCLVLSLALIGSAGAHALAGGDYDTGGGVGIPVPAPIPVPLYDPVWYFRIDASLGLADAPDVSESGMQFGRGNGTFRAAGGTFGSDPSWFSSDFEQEFAFGVGVGYRWASWLRTDLTAETIREREVHANDRRREALEEFDGTSWVAQHGYYEGAVQDDASLRAGLIMFNGYYDFNSYGWFRPYIGAGLGIGITRIDRTNSATETVDDRGDASGPVTPSNLTQLNSGSSNVVHHAVGLAASAMVGATFAVSDLVDVDLNYRYLWVDGMTSTLRVLGHNSTLTIDDMHDHQLRAGLRFNVN